MVGRARAQLHVIQLRYYKCPRTSFCASRIGQFRNKFSKLIYHQSNISFIFFRPRKRSLKNVPKNRFHFSKEELLEAFLATCIRKHMYIDLDNF